MIFSVSVAVILFSVQGKCFGFYHDQNPRIPVGFVQSFGGNPFSLQMDSKLKNLELKVNSLSSLSATVTAASTLITQVAEDQKETQDDLDALETEVAALKASVDPLVNPAASKKR